MMLNAMCAALAMGSPPPGSVENPKAGMMFQFGLIAMMVFMMYFVVIRPQRTRQKQLQSLLERVKPGDKVLTASGIVGVIITVKDKTVSIRSADTKLEILKSTISEITEKAGEAAAQS